MYTIQSSFRSSPRISETAFLGILQRSGALTAVMLWQGLADTYDTTEDAARAIYRFVVNKHHDPAVFLAICAREHRYGLDQNSVLWRNDTRSWTNARTVRDPLLKRTATVITDRVRRSGYVKYANVIDSVQDGIYRVDDPTYAYAGKTTLEEIFSVWTEDPEDYAAFVAKWLNDNADMEGGTSVTAQIPGFAWHPADGEHYQKGRAGQAIRGGAQHYTAGSNSLGWLTTDSGRDDPDARVSATFLVKKNATLSDRGWQLVRIEDTSWTTGGIVNPYTVAIEYEHKSGQPISDTDYEVLAQTWADITRYVRLHNLGDVQVVRGHREWTGNNSTVCPDGIDVARIERRRKELLAGSPPPTPVADSRTFDVPGIGSFTVGGGFLQFWDARGGLEVFGLPLSNELKEDGLTVQYFERARFEWHPGARPESWDVLLTRLGADAWARREAA